MNLNTMTAMLDYAWLLWLNLVALCQCSRLESGFFTKHSTDGARLSHRYTIENTGSILSCCAYCLRESSCLSVSFEENSGTCELFNNTYADPSFTTEDGWESYMKNGCPDGWTHHEERCYLFDTVESSWMSAVSDCHKKGGYIAEINSKAENDYLKQHLLGLGSSICFWIGGTDEHDENDWNWVTSDTPVTFFDWGHSREPNGQINENCLALLPLYDYAWADVGCSRPCYVICEI